jgi:hypothetical protein
MKIYYKKWIIHGIYPINRVFLGKQGHNEKNIPYSIEFYGKIV